MNFTTKNAPDTWVFLVLWLHDLRQRVFSWQEVKTKHMLLHCLFSSRHDNPPFHAIKTQPSLALTIEADKSRGDVRAKNGLTCRKSPICSSSSLRCSIFLLIVKLGSVDVYSWRFPLLKAAGQERIRHQSGRRRRATIWKSAASMAAFDWAILRGEQQVNCVLTTSKRLSFKIQNCVEHHN